MLAMYALFVPESHLQGLAWMLRHERHTLAQGHYRSAICQAHCLTWQLSCTLVPWWSTSALTVIDGFHPFNYMCWMAYAMHACGKKLCWTKLKVKLTAKTHATGEGNEPTVRCAASMSSAHV